MTEEQKNKTGVKVSVIVPVYNGEKYLAECLDSICAQTLREIEILCVDDGSTDASYAILQEYEARDARIRLYQQPNRSAGAARNRGMAHAVGEYLAFWDCDDYFAPDALEKLYGKAAATQADLCVCGANRYHDRLGKLEAQVRWYMDPRKVPQEEMFNRLTNEDNILNFTTAAPWNKIFRKAFLDETGLTFQEIRNGNDVYFTVLALCRAERIVTLEEALVTYRMNREESLTQTGTKAPLAPITAWATAAADLKAAGIFPERSFVNRAVANLIYLLRNLQSYAAFEEAVQALRDGTLDTMSITGGRGEAYYNNPWHAECVEHLLSDPVPEFMAYLAYYSYTQLQDITAEKQIAKENYQKRIKDLEESASFRIGRAVTWLPRKIRGRKKR